MNLNHIIKLLSYIQIICLFVNGNEHKRPNIVFIIADDFGWGDVSFHGSDQIPTPNIDTLASDGIILNNYYVSPICSPSRSALLTGYHPIHTGQQHNVLNGAEARGIPLKYKMLPEHLRNLGYSTVAIGKWHQGFYKKPYIPTERGFDSHFGYWTGHEDYYDRSSLENWWGIDFRRNEKPENISTHEGVYSTDMYTNEAINTIINHTNTSQRPLFLYLAYQSVHAGNLYHPLQAPQQYIDRFGYISDKRRRTFAAMVSSLDDAIGEIVSALYEFKILNNTIIIFTTDNGAATGGKKGYIDNSIGSNWPLRGAKYTLWEGGIRGISFLWNANFTNTYVSDHLMHIQDLMPTIYSAAGGDVKVLGPIDGIDYWDVIKHNLTSPRKELLHNIDDIWKVYAIRSGDYKLISGHVFNGNFDEWFLPPGVMNHTINENNFINSTFDWKSHINNCTVSKVLNNFGRNLKSNKRVLLNCHKKVQIECQPIHSPCLFNIREDPCEYNNIANKEPQIVNQLKHLLQKYNATAVPPDNKPVNPKANPVLHDQRWDIWD